MSPMDTAYCIIDNSSTILSRIYFTFYYNTPPDKPSSQLTPVFRCTLLTYWYFFVKH